MFSGNRKDMVDAKAMKFRDFGRLLLRINFVDHQEHRLPGPAQKPNKFLIRRCDAAPTVGNEENKNRSFDRNLCLLKYSNRDLRLFAWNDAAGIDNFVGVAMPVEDAINSIACDSRLVGYDRAPLADQAVEQCGLSYIRTSND